MINRYKNNKAASTLEYVILILIIMGAFVAFNPYFLRSFSGLIRSTGDSFGFGRQYDPNHTLECGIYYRSNIDPTGTSELSGTGDIIYLSDCFEAAQMRCPATQTHRECIYASAQECVVRDSSDCKDFDGQDIFPIGIE